MTTETRLKALFDRNGCLRVRQVDPVKGRNGGVELRIVVLDMKERKEVLEGLKTLGIGHGKVYRKQKTRRQWVVPIYSREDVMKFIEVVKPADASALLQKLKEASPSLAKLRQEDAP